MRFRVISCLPRGFVLSKTAVPLAAISLASIAIDFVSFAFTVATLLRVLWQELHDTQPSAA